MPPDASVAPSPSDVFQEKASSFSKAARWLPRQSRRQVTDLYNFLRMVDDLVDEHPHDAGGRLEELLAQIPPADAGGKARIKGVSFALDRIAVLDFLAGQKSDLAWQPVKTETELVDYCYKVAGTVGIMLCPVLGAQGEVARLSALRLGIAMQMTNISRDVLEDALRGRVYLPANWFTTAMTPAEITQASRACELIGVVSRLLRLAELYYRSASAGFHYLPIRERFAVILAMRLYRQIGRKIMSAPEMALRGRVRLSRGDRVRQFLAAGIEWLGLLRSPSSAASNAQDAGTLARHEA